MARSICGFFALSVLAAACGSSPGLETCPTTKQSLTFTAKGSCPGGNVTGMITVSTQPGLCTLLVKGATQVGLPTTGQFTGDASKTGYDLSKGNWSLTIQQGNAADGYLSDQCDLSMPGAKMFELNCSNTHCPPDSSGQGSCSYSKCVEHLTLM